MKTTSWMLLGAIFLAALEATAFAAPAVVPAMAATIAQLGQTEGRKATKQDVSELLKQARAAMQNGDLDAAEDAVERAEALEVSLGMFHLGDTPKKARRDLIRLRAQAKKTTPPSRKASPDDTQLLDRHKRPIDPEAQAQAARHDREALSTRAKRPANAAAGDSEAGIVATDRGRANPSGLPDLSPPADGEIITAPPADDGITSFRQVEGSDQHALPATKTGHPLWEARRSLAVGDVRRAAAMVDIAKRSPGGANPQNDSVAKVEALIKRQQAANAMTGARREEAIGRRELADLAIEQAEGLLRWGDLDTAESLALRAEQMGVEYGPFEAQPKQLIERIAAMKADKPGTLRQPARLASDATRNAAPLPGANAGLPAPGATPDDVAALTSQARAALQAGDLNLADAFARKALAAKLPDSQSPSDGDSPAQLFLEINKARRAQAQSGVMPATAPTQPGATGAANATYNEPVGGNRSEMVQPASFDFPDEADESPFDAQPDQQGAARPTKVTGQPAALQAPQQLAPQSDATRFLTLGETALKKNDLNTALLYFRRAERERNSLSQPEQARLAQFLIAAQQEQRPDGPPAQQPTLDPQPLPPVGGDNAESDPPAAQPAAPQRPTSAPAIPERRVDLQTGGPQPQPATPGNLPSGALLEDVSAGQRIAEKQLAVEVGRQQRQARDMRETDPKQALELLKGTRRLIEQSGVEPSARALLLRRVETTAADIQAYLEAHRADIELAEKNRATLDEIDREKQLKVEVDEKIARLVEEHNNLMDEHRYAEAELVVNKALELAPNEPIVLQLKRNSQLARNLGRAQDIQEMKDQGFVDALGAVDESSTPFDDRNPIDFGDAKSWAALTERRRKLALRDGPRRTERELQIERKLKTPVSLQFEGAALSEVIQHLGQLTGINIHLDPQGLHDEGVPTDTPVTINLKEDISLKSALNLILGPLHLGYVIKDEVLKITSEQYRSGEVTAVMYPVADLVIPIPNFVPGPRMGLADSLHQAYGDLGYGGGVGFANQSPLVALASKDGAPAAGALNPNVLANVASPSTMASAMLGGATGGPPTGAGPGGAAGGVGPDFDSLIQLITSTIEPQSWDEVGGSGSVQEFHNNLSLVISQTEDVHDEIRDLLAQLRRLQDLQVTIEVRFITLNDNFFERIGVDFDFNINTNTDKAFQIFGQQNPNVSTAYSAPPTSGFFNSTPRNFTKPPNNSAQPNAVVGVAAPGVFSADLDIPFTQNNFGLAVPQFGGFDPTAGAQIGFAILSDIEAFFFVNAAQGDRRTNVLQAPKVTLFNGQLATVSDTSQSPFVISVIPVVGDFAAAQQPVIVVLNEGTFMSVQATVSSDRRFVRLTIVPFFSNIGEVNTFTFEGRTTTRETSSSTGPTDSTTARSADKETTTSGTTVQLPTFSFVTVTTTVSVPDGGTVLLGGIKRLSEGRSEFGTPILNKIPYVNRLFKNVGIGRETQSLMMMVTPRIIIQEEEESLLGITPTP